MVSILHPSTNEMKPCNAVKEPRVEKEKDPEVAPTGGQPLCLAHLSVRYGHYPLLEFSRILLPTPLGVYFAFVRLGAKGKACLPSISESEGPPLPLTEQC